MKLNRFFPLFVFIVFSLQIQAESLESIMKIHDNRIEKAKNIYDRNVKKTTDQTIQKLEYLKKVITRTGKLKEAIAIQNQINKLKGLPLLTEEPKEKEDVGGIPVNPDESASLSQRKTQKKLEKRYMEFYEAIIEKDYDKAIEYLDPSMVKSVDQKVIEGHLQLIGGALHIFQVRKSGIGVERVKFTKKLKEARITGKLRSSLTGKWKESDKPSYWIYKKGDWYLGDEKELKKLF